MDEFKIVREEILKDRQNFSLANDIFNNFQKIKNELISDCSKKITYEISTFLPDAQFEIYDWYANNQYIDITIENNIMVQLKFDNFYKNPCLKYLNENEQIISCIKNKYLEKWGNKQEIYISLKNYNFNKINTTLDLYDLYIDTTISQELLGQITDTIKDELIDFITIIKKCVNSSNQVA